MAVQHEGSIQPWVLTATRHDGVLQVIGELYWQLAPIPFFHLVYGVIDNSDRTFVPHWHVLHW